MRPGTNRTKRETPKQWASRVAKQLEKEAKRLEKDAANLREAAGKVRGS